MYNRKTLCQLAGIQLEAFKEAARIDPNTGADNLPISTGDEGRAGTYARYTPLDVLAIACATQLAAGGGLVTKAMPFANAAKIIAGSTGFLGAAVRSKRDGNGLVMIGYVVLEEGGFCVADTMGKIGLKVASDYADEVTAMYLVSPAKVAAAIEERAHRLGIDWQSDRLWASGE